MSKLLTNIALGASAGIAAGGLVYYFEQRAKTPEKPLIPSGLLALATSLDPLLKGSLLYARTTIDRLLDTVDAGDTSDGGDEQTEEGPFTPFPGELVGSNAGEQGHPAGPGFAPTPA